MKYFIGVDLGTSSLKLLLVDENGEIKNTVSREYEVHFPSPGWSEQFPEDWWKALVDGMNVLTKDVQLENIAGLGVAGQMHGLVILDKEDQVIRPTILWNDGRTNQETEYLNEEIGKEKINSWTANIAFAGFTAPKLIWLKKHEPENFRRISKIMLPKDYLNYRMTGVHATDYSDASGMLLLDVKKKRWSEEMLDLCGVKEEQMPLLFESYEIIGKLLPEVATELGLNPGISIVAGAGDNAAAAVGTGTIGEGGCNISLGTSGTVFMSSNQFKDAKSEGLHAFCHADGGYHLMGCILSAASCNKWFCEEILNTDHYESEQADITEGRLGNNHVFFLPYLMGERGPINDTEARGTFLGMRMDTSRSDLVQAVLEGVAFAIRDNIEVAKASGIQIDVSGLCGGGAKSPLWQTILCNVLNIPLQLLQTEEGPGYGGAMLAMVGAKKYADVSECVKQLVKVRKTILPISEVVARYEKQYRKFQKIYPSLKQLFKEIK